MNLHSIGNNRMSSIKPSVNLATNEKAQKMICEGIDVINMTLGESMSLTPDFIKDAARKAIDDDATKYTPISGTVQIRNAIVAKFKRENN